MKFFGILIVGMLLAGQAWAQAPVRPAIPASAHEENARYGWADVLRVDPVYDDGAPPVPAQQGCYDEQVPTRAPASGASSGGNRTAASVFGAIIGGILGHQVGKGDGRKAATAAGAVAGAVVGNNVAAANERPDQPAYTTVRRCPPSEGGNSQRRVVAYDVEYRYRGEIYTSRLGYDPGDRIRVRVSVVPAE
jgi:uncharacterized protein YcfJ